MSIVMQLQDVAESTRLGPLSGEVRAGEILHLVGPNGAGKSTLLARMAGMTSGKGSIQFAGFPHVCVTDDEFSVCNIHFVAFLGFYVWQR